MTEASRTRLYIPAYDMRSRKSKYGRDEVTCSSGSTLQVCRFSLNEELHMAVEAQVRLKYFQRSNVEVQLRPTEKILELSWRVVFKDWKVEESF